MVILAGYRYRNLVEGMPSVSCELGDGTVSTEAGFRHVVRMGMQCLAKDWVSVELRKSVDALC